jgi:hypothetical protein
MLAEQAKPSLASKPENFISTARAARRTPVLLHANKPLSTHSPTPGGYDPATLHAPPGRILAFPPCLGSRPVTDATPRTQAIGDDLRRRKLVPILRLAAVAAPFRGDGLDDPHLLLPLPAEVRLAGHGSFLPQRSRGIFVLPGAAESDAALRCLTSPMAPPTHGDDRARARRAEQRGCESSDRWRGTGNASQPDPSRRGTPVRCHHGRER